MPSDIFSVSPPAWLSEITTGDTQANAARATALGLAARRQQDESRIMGLRVQAQMLQSQARIQALEHANESAAMRLQAQQQQMDIAKQRLELASTGAAMKAEGQKEFLNRISKLPEDSASAIHEMYPNWADFSPTGGPTSAQWLALGSAEKSQQSKATAGMTPTKVTTGPEGITQTFESPDATKAGSPLGKLQADRSIALQKGDMEAVKQYDAAIQESISNKGKSIYLGMDDNGRPIFQMTEGGAATVGMQTGAQEKLAQFQNSLELMNTLQKQLKPGDVGIKGKVGEVVVDKTLAQFMPGVAVGSRIDARTALKILRSSLLRQVPDASSGKMSSVAEREEVEAALPETGMVESYPDVMQKLNTLRTTLQNRAQVYSKSIGKETPLWSQSPEEIKAQFKANKITEAQALDALTRFH